jgi:hypothetical protein
LEWKNMMGINNTAVVALGTQTITVQKEHSQRYLERLIHNARRWSSLVLKRFDATSVEVIVESVVAYSARKQFVW